MRATAPSTCVLYGPAARARRRQQGAPRLRERRLPSMTRALCTTVARRGARGTTERRCRAWGQLVGAVTPSRGYSPLGEHAARLWSARGAGCCGLPQRRASRRPYESSSAKRSACVPPYRRRVRFSSRSPRTCHFRPPSSPTARTRRRHSERQGRPQRPRAQLTGRARRRRRRRPPAMPGCCASSTRYSSRRMRRRACAPSPPRACAEPSSLTRRARRPCARSSSCIDSQPQRPPTTICSRMPRLSSCVPRWRRAARQMAP